NRLSLENDVATNVNDYCNGAYYIHCTQPWLFIHCTSRNAIPLDDNEHDTISRYLYRYRISRCDTFWYSNQKNRTITNNSTWRDVIWHYLQRIHCGNNSLTDKLRYKFSKELADL